MNLLSEKILLKLPIFLQNFALSMYGARVQHFRYGRDYNKLLLSSIYRLELGSAELEEYCNDELQKIIRESVTNVQYYKNLFKRKRLSISDILNTDDLRKIPILNKDAIRENPLLFINKKYNKNRLSRIHTTGTTGTPLQIYCNRHVRQSNYAFYTRFLISNNINSVGKRATFGGRIIVSSHQEKPPFWRYSFFQKNLLFSSYHLTNKNIRFYIEKLKKFRPDYIDSYPSSIFAIADFAYKNNIDLKGTTKRITTSAETIFHEQRAVIEHVFDVPVVDQYGAAEMCVFVGQCPVGNYHLHKDYGIIEFLRENGDKAEPGEEAEIVCTGLINYIMPLIRYRIGDRAVYTDKKCKCGSPFPVVENILGRTDDVIITPDGRKIGRLSPVLKGFPVKEAQYIQKNIETVKVLLVKDDGYSDETDISVVEELRKRLGNTINIKIIHVPSIARGASAKLKSIVSELSKEY